MMIKNVYLKYAFLYQKKKIYLIPKTEMIFKFAANRLNSKQLNSAQT